jgi:hypothetical protein
MSGIIATCKQWIASPICTCVAHVLVANVWKEYGAEANVPQGLVTGVCMAADIENAITVTVGADVGYELLACTLKQ